MNQIMLTQINPGDNDRTVFSLPELAKLALSILEKGLPQIPSVLLATSRSSAPPKRLQT